jgi:hypothetical protein
MITESAESRPRSVVAYDVARRLIYHTSAVDLSVSPVRSAQVRLDILRRAKRLTEVEHQALSALLCAIEGCDADLCYAKDELVTKVTRELAAMKDCFPDEHLAQLAAVV